MCSFGSTEFNLYSVRHSKAAIGSFITRIFAELCIILREINHPLTDGLCIISWRTNSVGQYTESRRLYSLLLGMEYGWSTSSAMYYTSDRARTLVAREVVLRLLSRVAICIISSGSRFTYHYHIWSFYSNQVNLILREERFSKQVEKIIRWE